MSNYLKIYFPTYCHGKYSCIVLKLKSSDLTKIYANILEPLCDFGASLVCSPSMLKASYSQLIIFSNTVKLWLKTRNISIKRKKNLIFVTTQIFFILAT